MATTVVGSKIYFFGGMETTDYYSRNTSYSYDTVTDEWNALADIPYNRYGMCSATDGERIWVFGESFVKGNSLCHSKSDNSFNQRRIRCGSN